MGFVGYLPGAVLRAPDGANKHYTGVTLPFFKILKQCLMGTLTLYNDVAQRSVTVIGWLAWLPSLFTSQLVLSIVSVHLQ